MESDLVENKNENLTDLIQAGSVHFVRADINKALRLVSSPMGGIQ